MKKFLLVLLSFVLFLIVPGCKKDEEVKEPYLTLIYDGYTNTTLAIEYEENEQKTEIQGEYSTDTLEVSKGGKLKYYMSRSNAEVKLIIEEEKTKETVKDVKLEDKIVPTDLPVGKYLYTFYSKWENGNGKFIKWIEIK